MDEAFRRAIECDGFAIVPGLIALEEVDRLIEGLPAEGHAIRNLMEGVPRVAVLARSPSVRAAAEAILGPSCFAVRGLFFDKTPGANWKVAWHQDQTIAVRDHVEVPGFGPWSEKAGIPHVRPPSAILSRMLTIRVHLDPCGEKNGPLRVLAGSHNEGILDAESIARRREAGERTITVGRGDALVMRPLLLHASSPADEPAHRRVFHLEFAAEDLPGGLEWHGRW